MIADLNPYPEYKESGVPWLRQVPAHWSVKRIKTVLRETDRRSVDGSGTLLSLTRVRGLIPHKDMTDKVHSAKTLVGYKRYSAGQLVMNRMQAWSGMFGAGEIDGLVSPDYAVFDVLGGHAIKLVLVRLKTADLVAQFALESKGIGSGFNRLYTDRFGSIPISLPPADEQAAIVHFLDWANGRMERALRAKRKVIALLNEQKHFIIHRAVTRGIDPSASLKLSGIPWLGEIPAHWEVLPLRRLLAERKEKNDPIKTNNILSLSLHAGVIPYADKKPGGNKAKDDLSAYMLAYPGDIVLNSMNVVVGSVGLSKYFGAVSPVYYMLHPRCSDDLVEFFDAIFQDRAFQRSLFGLGNGILVIQSRATGKLNTIRMRIPMTKLRRIQLPRPAPEEQAAIVEYLAHSKSNFDNAINTAGREVDLLLEYRSRLISDVVTGKLDVREAAARLPVETPPDTAEDDIDLSDETESADEEVAA